MDPYRIELAHSAKIAVERCMGVQGGEKVLVVTDTMMSPRIGEALMAQSKALGADASLIIYPARKFTNEEPPGNVKEAMRASDAVFTYTSTSLTHTDARREAQAAGARVITMPRILEDQFIRTVRVDFDAMSALTQKVGRALQEAKRVRIRTPAGTDVEWEQAGRPAFAVDGICRGRGAFSQIPPGLTFIAPLEGTASGRIVVDGAMAKVGEPPMSSPIHWTVERGKIVKIEGGIEARKLEKLLEEVGDPNAYNCPAEWGIGTNPVAILSNAIEGERCFGLVHIGIGDNHTVHGTVKCKLHLDAILLSPTVELDGKAIVEGGKFRI